MQNVQTGKVLPDEMTSSNLWYTFLEECCVLLFGANGYVAVRV